MLPNQPVEDSSSSFQIWLEPILRNPLTSMLLAAFFLTLDFFTGPAIQMGLAFVFPVAICAWYSSRRLAYFLAVAQSLIRLCFVLTWETPWGVPPVIINAIIRIIVLCLIVAFVTKAAARSRELSRRAKILSGNLSICLECKKIQDERQEWEDVELYVARRSEATFQHSLCPDCATTHYQDILGKP